MAGQYTRLRVLVASPDDVLEERSIAKQVIDDINQSFRDRPIRLEFLGWEDASPGFSTDPQAVIDAQVGDDYEVFVGILWTRFGTPTPRASSGTEEEFLRAYQRWKDNPETIHLMVFFSDVPFSPSECDPEQLARVKRFQQEVSDKGGFYRNYRSKEEFQRLLTVALNRRVIECNGAQRAEVEPPSRDSAAPLPPSPPATAAPVPAGEEAAAEEAVAEEAGLLDLLANGTTDMKKATATAVEMTEGMRELRERFEKRTAQLTRTKDTALIRRYIDGAASDLMQFVKRIEGELVVFVSAYGTGMDSYSRAVQLLPQFDEPVAAEVEGSLRAVRLMGDSLVESGASIEKFRQIVADMPPATTALIKARREAVRILDRLTQEWLAAIQLASDMDGLLTNILSHQAEGESG